MNQNSSFGHSFYHYKYSQTTLARDSNYIDQNDPNFLWKNNPDAFLRNQKPKEQRLIVRISTDFSHTSKTFLRWSPSTPENLFLIRNTLVILKKIKIFQFMFDPKYQNARKASNSLLMNINSFYVEAILPRAILINFSVTMIILWIGKFFDLVVRRFINNLTVKIFWNCFRFFFILIWFAILGWNLRRFFLKKFYNFSWWGFFYKILVCIAYLSLIHSIFRWHYLRLNVFPRIHLKRKSYAGEFFWFIQNCLFLQNHKRFSLKLKDIKTKYKFKSNTIIR